MHLVKVLKGIRGVKGICNRMNFTKLAKTITGKIRNQVASGLITTHNTTMTSLPRLVWARSWHGKSVDVWYITLSTRIMALVECTGDINIHKNKLTLSVNCKSD